MINMSCFRIKKFQVAVIICLIGIFVTGSVLRNGIYSGTLLKQHSPLIYIGLFLSVNYIRAGAMDQARKKVDTGYFRFDMLCIILSSIIMLIEGTLFSNLNSFISIILPVLVISYRFRDSEMFLDIMRIFNLFMKLCMFLMLGSELIDICTGFSVTHAIANYTGVASLLRMYNQKRCVTYMGHALFSSEIFLAGYILGHMYKKSIGIKDSILDILIPIIGITLTQSRAGVLLVLAVFVVFNFEWKKASRILALLIILAIAFQVGVFDSFISRILGVVATGDFTAGRNASIESLIATGGLKFYWFRGQVIEYTGAVTSLGMALEYPILCWAYAFGIVIAILLTLCYMIIPLIKSVIMRDKEIFFSILFLSLDVMSYSGIANNGDKALLFALFICILLNYMNYFQLQSRRAQLWLRK